MSDDDLGSLSLTWSKFCFLLFFFTGRDGDPAFCYLFYAHSDALKLRKMLEKDCSRAVYKEKLLRLSLLVDVIQTPLRCLRQILLLFLDEVWDFDCLTANQIPCSVCQNVARKISLDITQESLTVVRFLRDQEYIKESEIVDTLSGTLNMYQSFTWVYGCLKHWCRKLIVFFIQELRLKGYIVNTYNIVNGIPVAFLTSTDKVDQILSMEQPLLLMLTPSPLLPSKNQSLITYAPARVVRRHHHVLNKRFKPKIPKIPKSK